MPAFSPVFGYDSCTDAATYIENRAQPHKTGCGSFDKVVKNLIGDRFMKGTFISEAPDIQFERFKFNTLLVRNILKCQRGKIRLTGLGAQAGKLRHAAAATQSELRQADKRGPRESALPVSHARRPGWSQR